MAPTSSRPASGCSSPTIIRKRVVLPAPLGPMTPTMPPGGRRNDRPSMSNRSPKPLTTRSASTTRSPSRGPGGEANRPAVDEQSFPEALDNPIGIDHPITQSRAGGDGYLHFVGPPFGRFRLGHQIGRAHV